MKGHRGSPHAALLVAAMAAVWFAVPAPEAGAVQYKKVFYIDALLPKLDPGEETFEVGVALGGEVNSWAHLKSVRERKALVKEPDKPGEAEKQ